MKHIIYDLPEFAYRLLKFAPKRQGLPSYPNAVADAQRILRERLKATNCPNCGGPLDKDGCCPVCLLCPLPKPIK